MLNFIGLALIACAILVLAHAVEGLVKAIEEMDD